MIALIKKFEEKLIKASGPDWDRAAYIMGMDELVKVTNLLRRIPKMENEIQRLKVIARRG